MIYMEIAFNNVCDALTSGRNIRTALTNYKDLLSSMPIFGQRKERKELTDILASKEGIDLKQKIIDSTILNKIKKWKTIIDELKEEEKKKEVGKKKEVEKRKNEYTNIYQQLKEITEGNLAAIDEMLKITDPKKDHVKYQALIRCRAYFANNKKMMPVYKKGATFPTEKTLSNIKKALAVSQEKEKIVDQYFDINSIK